MNPYDDDNDADLTPRGFREYARAVKRREREQEKALKFRTRAQALNAKADELDPQIPHLFKFWYRVPATGNPPTLISDDTIEYTLDSGTGPWSRVTLPWNAGPATFEEGDEIVLEGVLTKKNLFFKRGDLRRRT